MLENETCQLYPELDGYNICVELLYVGSCQCRPPQESISIGHSEDMSAKFGSSLAHMDSADGYLTTPLLHPYCCERIDGGTKNKA